MCLENLNKMIWIDITNAGYFNTRKYDILDRYIVHIQKKNMLDNRLPWEI